MNKKTERLITALGKESERRDILESELFKMLKYRKMLAGDNKDTCAVIGTLPQCLKEQYNVLGCFHDDIFDRWVTVLDVSKPKTEEWKPIGDNYEVSNLGGVRSLGNGKTRRTKVLRPYKTPKGYLRVNLYKDGKQNSQFVHRLVCEAFIGKIPEGMEVNHIDENKENNCIDNICLMSHYENCRYGTRNRRISEAEKNNLDKSRTVLQFTLDGKFVREWPSANECGRNGFKQSCVSACCRNCFNREGNNVYKGYIWKYADNFFNNLEEI